jgi:FAD/FMN-containing dehydrogenase
LTPLIIGSQGTLGIITEAILEVVPHNPRTTTVLISLENLDDITELLPKITHLRPSVFDMVNKTALAQVAAVNPNQLVGAIEDPKADIHLFVEFDDVKEGVIKKKTKRLQKIVSKLPNTIKITDKTEGQEAIWKLRQSVATILTQPHGQSKAVPIVEDISIPPTKLVEYLKEVDRTFYSVGLRAAAWGHAGDGIVRTYPILDLGNLGDRQKLFKISEAVYELVIRMGGSISATAGDGRVRAPYLGWQYEPQLYNVMLQVKKIFDPLNILNPGVKTASLEQVKTLMRGEYSLGHHHEHLPRS